MRKIGFTQCNGEIKEILPSSFKIKMQEQKRKMFICMLNEFLDDKAQIKVHKSTFYKLDLRYIFTDKILSFFQAYKLRPEQAKPGTRFYTKDSTLFNQFLKQINHPKANFLASRWEFDKKFEIKQAYVHPASSLIELIFNGTEVEMMLDLNELFTQTVFKRIKASQDSTVSLDMPYIHINEKGKRTRLIPSWKKIKPKELHTQAKQINEGFKQLSNDAIDQCYLIYPKTDEFRQHIILKQAVEVSAADVSTKDKEEHQIKVIPYSFTFTTR